MIMQKDNAINIQVTDKRLGGLNPLGCGYEDCDPGHFFGPKIRFQWVIHYIRSGCGIYRINGIDYSVSAGQMFIIPPYAETYYIADKYDPWHYSWICFDNKGQIPVVLNSPVINLNGAGEIFDDILQCTKFKSGRTEYLASCLWKLWGLFQEMTPEEKDVRPIDRALNIIHSEYYRGITTTEVASKLGLNRSYFSFMFTKETGVSPIKYINDLRMKKAAELMINHDITPASAAVAIGYSDMSNFSNAFKKYYGLSPSKYILAHK